MWQKIKVIELASVLAGPLVGTFFAELGAQVLKIENKTLILLDQITKFNVNERKIVINKVIPVQQSVTKYYLLTNVGILIAYHLSDNFYEITTLFLETTPGRLIFNHNFKKAIKI